MKSKYPKKAIRMGSYNFCYQRGKYLPAAMPLHQILVYLYLEGGWNIPMTGPFRAATRIFLCEYNCKIPFSRFQHGCRNPSHSLPAIRGCARNRPQISLSNICIGRDCRRRRWSTLDICTTVFYLLNIPSAPRKSMWLTRRTSFLGLDKFEYKDTTRHCYFMLR